MGSKKTHLLACIAAQLMGIGLASPSVALEQQGHSAERGTAPAAADRAADVEVLRAKAESITKRIGELASSGRLPTSDEALKALKDLVQELSAVNEQLKKLQEDIEALKVWVREQPSPKALAADLERLRRTAWTSYLHFQWSDTQEPYPGVAGTRNDGFALRRVRLTATNQIDRQTQARVSIEFAGGSQRLAAELKDAFVTYRMGQVGVGGSSLMAGQQPMPLGYELGRSSTERELPERTVYNRTLMSGERNRGIRVVYGLGTGSTLQAGLWNALTVSDPQQVAANSFRNTTGAKVGASLGLRHQAERYDVGLSGFVADRAPFSGGPVGGTVTAPGGQRRLVYLDGAYRGVIHPRLSLRGEAMWGRDRVPTLSSGGAPRSTEFANLMGWHAQAVYSLDARNRIAVRYEFFDPDTGSRGDTIRGIGISYLHDLGPLSRLMIAHERFDENPIESRDNVTTLRLQVRL